MVFLIQFLSLLIHRNTNNFGILIFYPTILINLQLSSFFKKYFYLFIWLVVVCGILFPDQEWNLCPLHWKHGILTTGPPGNPSSSHLVMSLCLTIFDLMDCSPPGPIPFSRGSSQSRDHTWDFCIEGRFFTIWATVKSPKFLFNSVPSSPRREHSPWLKARTFLSSSFYLFQLFFCCCCSLQSLKEK